MIQIKNLSYRFNKKGTDILKNVNLTLQNGQIYGILGLNGSGKTTLLSILAGLIKPTEGTVLFDDNLIWNNQSKKTAFKEINKKTGILFQFSSKQLFNQSVFEDVMFVLNNYLPQLENKDQLIKRYFNLFELNSALWNKSAFELSDGQKRKVALTCLFVLNKEVILLDEPTVGLDFKTKLTLTNLIKELKKQNKLIVIVSHEIDWIYAFSDELILLDPTISVLQKPTSDFFQLKKVLQLYPYLPLIVQIQQRLKNENCVLPTNATNWKSTHALLNYLKKKD